MTPIIDSPPDDLIAFFLFSNTPRYLFQHFRENPYVKALAENNTLEEIVNYFCELMSQKSHSPIEATLAYSLLISLAFIDYNIAFPALIQLDLSNLDWGDDIRDILLKTSKTTKIELVYPTLHEWGEKREDRFFKTTNPTQIEFMSHPILEEPSTRLSPQFVNTTSVEHNISSPKKA